ncbi:MAG: DUF3078 domain-containing protein [Elusimicrobia bacterium]|jgi:hypothetical protein|nr:DUF3078 domain-containing protein [Elusimicrobiota bacterium]
MYKNTKRRFVLFCFIILLAGGLNAGWDTDGYIGAQGGLSVISDNWSGEETNSTGWSVKVHATAVKKEDRYKVSNILRYEYGKVSVGGADELEKADELYLESSGVLVTKAYVRPYGSVNTRTQSTDFFDPATLTESAGLEAEFLTKSSVSSLITRLGIAFKQNFQTDRETLKEVGSEWNTEYKLNLNEKLKLTSRLEFFTAFDAGTDFRSENDIYYKLSDIITLQAGYVVLHEYSEIGPRPDLPEDIQTKFSLSAGISYNLFTKNK